MEEKTLMELFKELPDERETKDKKYCVVFVHENTGEEVKKYISERYFIKSKNIIKDLHEDSEKYIFVKSLFPNKRINNTQHISVTGHPDFMVKKTDERLEFKLGNDKLREEQLRWYEKHKELFNIYTLYVNRTSIVYPDTFRRMEFRKFLYELRLNFCRGKCQVFWSFDKDYHRDTILSIFVLGKNRGLPKRAGVFQELNNYTVFCSEGVLSFSDTYQKISKNRYYVTEEFKNDLVKAIKKYSEEC